MNRATSTLKSARKNGLTLAALALPAVFLLSACGSSATASSAATTSTPASTAAAPAGTSGLSDAQVMALFDEWNASLATGDPSKVVAQYAEDGVLLPTVNGKVHDTAEELTEYFTEFLKIKPQGTWLETDVIQLGPDAVALVGLYNFAVTSDGKPDTVKARGTFIFEKQTDGQWQIVHHHSSKVPV